MFFVELQLLQGSTMGGKLQASRWLADGGSSRTGFHEWPSEERRNERNKIKGKEKRKERKKGKLRGREC